MQSLLQRYGHLALPLPSGNETVLVEPWVPTSTNGVVSHSDQIIRMPASLLAVKEQLIQQEQDRDTVLYDGDICILSRSVPGFLTVVKGQYFDCMASSVALSQELSRDQWPLRDRIDFVCQGDPLHNGRGRHSGMSIVALLVFEHQGQQLFCLGKRNQDLAYFPGLWHGIPSGGLDWGQGVSGTLKNELQEELIMSQEQVEQTMQTSQVIGLIHNLVTLSTDIAVVCHCQGPLPIACPSEHSELRCWTFDQQGIAQALQEVSVSNVSEALLTLADIAL